ncbi:hypothetical protein GGR40_004269 [Novosphingobium gossypii]
MTASMSITITVVAIVPVAVRRAVSTRSVIGARGQTGASDHQQGHSKFQVTGHSLLQAGCVARRCSLGE